MMRHFLFFPRPIPPHPVGMFHLALTGFLIASASLMQRLTAGCFGTGFAAVCLAAITSATDQHLGMTTHTIKKTGGLHRHLSNDR